MENDEGRIVCAVSAAGSFVYIIPDLLVCVTLLSSSFLILN